MSHFVVVFKISREYVVIGDPAKDLVRMTLDEFYKEFTGVTLILKPSADFKTGKLKAGTLYKNYINLLLPHI